MAKKNRANYLKKSMKKDLEKEKILTDSGLEVMKWQDKPGSLSSVVPKDKSGHIIYYDSRTGKSVLDDEIAGRKNFRKGQEITTQQKAKEMTELERLRREKLLQKKIEEAFGE